MGGSLAFYPDRLKPQVVDVLRDNSSAEHVVQNACRRRSFECASASKYRVALRDEARFKRRIRFESAGVSISR